MNLITDFVIAYESYDHIEPKGTMNDNTHCPAFVTRVEELSDGRKIKFADLGCSGGGLVKDFIDETVLAWDPRTGQALSQAIVWQDNRSAGICEGLLGHAELIARRTGLVLRCSVIVVRRARTLD